MTARQREWRTSARFREIARETGKRNVAAWTAAPRCGALAKRSGEPCRQMALENGRCYLHGGRTPRGDKWHLPAWPNKHAPDAEQKLHRKLKDLARAKKKRNATLAAMTPDERAAFDAWQRAHPPGSAAARKAAKERRREAAAARERFAKPNERESSAAALDLIAYRERLEARVAEIDREIEAREMEQSRPNLGAFE